MSVSFNINPITRLPHNMHAHTLLPCSPSLFLPARGKQGSWSINIYDLYVQAIHLARPPPHVIADLDEGGRWRDDGEEVGRERSDAVMGFT